MAEENARPTAINDYHVLPLQLPSLPCFPKGSRHYLYVRPHEPRIPDADSQRSLFIANVPFDSTERHFRAIFAEQLGKVRVERVDFENTRPTKKRGAADVTTAHHGRKNKKRKRGDDGSAEDPDMAIERVLPQTWDRELHAPGGAAVVVFVDKPSLDSAMKAVKKMSRTRKSVLWEMKTEEDIMDLGSRRYKAHSALRYPDKDELQSVVDDYMAKFADIEKERSRKRTALRSLPDEDGFITVTRGGRVGPARMEEANEKLEEKTRQEEKKRNEMGDFYRFQLREKKKEQAGQLIKKFEQDRKRVNAMKGNRFKPM